MNITEVLARVVQLQTQSAATRMGVAPGRGTDFAALLAAAQTATAPAALPSTTLPTGGSLGLLPLNLRTATLAAEPAQPAATGGEMTPPAAARSCRCVSH